MKLPQDQTVAAAAAAVAVEHLYQKVLKVSKHFDMKWNYEVIR